MWMGGKREGRMTCWMEERWRKVNISIEGRGKRQSPNALQVRRP